MILDEATLSLYSTAGAYVYKTIAYMRQKGETIVLIAHRLRTVVHADKIVVISKDALVE